MMDIPSQKRLLLGSTLIGTSVILLLATYVWTLVRVNGQDDSTATVAQYRRNLTASTTPTLSVPTQTNITISFPQEMTINETRGISVKIARFTVGLDLPTEGSSDEVKFEKKLEPVKTLEDDAEVNLVSSGFDIDGLSTAKEGTPYPLTFMWTISPKKEGKHELLLDLSEFVRDSRTDGQPIGTTEVRLRDDKIELRDGTTLPLQVSVRGQFGLPSWAVTTGASLPGFLGFILTYPLFLEWLKRRRKPKPNNRLNAKTRKRGR